MSEAKAERALVIGRALAAAAMVLWSGSVAVRRPIDDLYIVAAFAHEWARTGHLQWTTGQVVEGMTSLPWVAAMIPGVWMGLDLGIWARLLSYASAVALLLIWSAIAPRDRATSTLIVLTGAWAGFACLAVIGFEASLYGGLVALGWTALLGRRSELACGLLLAAALVRPEGIALLAVALVDVARSSRRVDLALGTTLAAALWWLGRRWYFGDWLPTSFLAKVVGDGQQGHHGVAQVGWDIVWASGPIGLVLATRKPLERWGLALVPLVSGAALLIAMDGDWFGYSRMMMPGLLAWIVASSVLTERRERPVPTAAVAPVLLTLIGVPLSGTTLSWAAMKAQTRPLDVMVRPWTAYLGGFPTPIELDVAWAIERMPAGGALLTADVGMVGNIPEVRIRDQVGLVDRPFALAAAGRGPSPLDGDVFGPPPKPFEAWCVTAAPGFEFYAREVEAHRERLRTSELVVRPDMRLEFLVADDARPAPELVLARWEGLARRFPSQPWLVWRLGRLVADSGDYEGALSIVRDGASLWPLADLARNPEAWLSFTDPSVLWPVYADGSGYAIYGRSSLNSRPIRPDEALTLSVDPAGAALRLRWPSCGTGADVTVGRAAVALPPACSPQARLEVSRLDEGSEPIFVFLRPTVAADLPVEPFHPDVISERAWIPGRGHPLYWNQTLRTGLWSERAQIALHLDVDNPGVEGAIATLAFEPSCGVEPEVLTVRGPLDVRRVAPCAAALAVSFTNDVGEPDRNLYVEVGAVP